MANKKMAGKVVAINEKEERAVLQAALKRLENFKDPAWTKNRKGPAYVPQTREEALRLMGKIKSIDRKDTHDS
jgi:hypothetical protein